METKQEEEEEGEAGFMQDRRVVERDPDQDGGEVMINKTFCLIVLIFFVY